MKPHELDVPKWLLHLINHLYEVEAKMIRARDPAGTLRNIEKMKEALASQGFFYEDPFGQEFRETRTDLEATISGIGTENLCVVEVIKPIVRHGDSSYSRVVQRGIVVVQSKDPSARISDVGTEPVQPDQGKEHLGGTK